MSTATKKVVAYREPQSSKDHVVLPSTEAIHGGLQITVPNYLQGAEDKVEYREIIPLDKGFLALQKVGSSRADNYERIVSLGFSLKDLRGVLPIVTKQQLEILGARGNNAVIQRRIGSETEWFLCSLSDQTIKPIGIKIGYHKEPRNINCITPANKASVAVMSDEKAKNFSLMPLGRLRSSIPFDEKTSVVDLVFCNHDKWLCFLTTQDDKAFNLEFFDVKTVAKVQELHFRDDQVSDDWNTLQTNLDGTSLYIPDDQVLFDWNGEQFEKVADISTPGIREIFANRHVEACALNPTGENIALRLRNKELTEGDSRKGDYWLLDTKAFRDAAGKLEKNLAAGSESPIEKKLADRQPAEIPFDLKRHDQPGDLLLRWEVDRDTGSLTENVFSIGNDRWIATQVVDRTLVYDLWSDQSFDLNSLAWDHHRLGELKRDEIELVRSHTVSPCPDSNELVMAGPDAVYLWNLAGRTPVLVQHAKFPRSRKGQETEFETFLRSSRDYVVTCVKQASEADGGRRLLFWHSGGFAVVLLLENEIKELSINVMPVRQVTLSEDHDRLYVLNSRKVSSDEYEMRVYGMFPDVTGEAIRAVPTSVISLANPFQEQVLLQGEYQSDGVFAGKLGAAITDMTHFNIECSRCLFQPASSEWIMIDGEPPKDSTRLYRFSKDFELFGTMTIPRLDDRSISGITSTSDSKFLAINHYHEGAVWLFPSHWEQDSSALTMSD